MTPPRCVTSYYRGGEWTSEPPKSEGRYVAGVAIRQHKENRYMGVVDAQGFVVRLVPVDDATFMQFMRQTVTQFPLDPTEIAA